MDKILSQEGQVSVKEADSPESGQDDANRLPMGLPRPVVQANTPYELYEHSSPSVIPQVQGFKQFSTVSPKNSSTVVENVNFPGLNVSNDKRENRVCRSQPARSSSPRLHLPPIKDKTALRRRRASYEMNPARETHTEEKSYNVWRKMIKSNAQKREPVENVSHFLPEIVPPRKKLEPIIPKYILKSARGAKSVSRWPLRDRVIHLLALKDYKKTDLLSELQKDDSKLIDTNFLGKILLLVANLNATTLSYTLKDYMFKEVRRDWPGYNMQDKLILDLILPRKRGRSYKATEDTHYPESSVVPNEDHTLCAKDKPSYFPDTDYLMKKKIGLSLPKSSVRSTAECQLRSNSERSAILPVIGKPGPAQLLTTDLCISNPSLIMKSNPDIYSTPEKPMSQEPSESISNGDRIFERQQKKPLSSEAPILVSRRTKYCKPKESQYVMCEDKCPFTKQNMTTMDYKSNMMKKQKQKQKHNFQKPEEGARLNSSKVQRLFPLFGETPSPTRPPDYLANYFTIVSSEQRQCYEMDFKVYYNEYKAICDKINTSCSEIIKLDLESKALAPNSKEYKKVNKKMLLEYQKVTETDPNFSAEQRRCAYLCMMLNHIRKLINAFDEKHQVRAVEESHDQDEHN